MKDLFKEWLSQNSHWETDTEGWEDNYRRDDSEFVVVDGEEGDYEIMRYYDEYNLLFATETVHGGDYSDIEFTSAANRAFRGFCGNNEDDNHRMYAFIEWFEDNYNRLGFEGVFNFYNNFAHENKREYDDNFSFDLLSMQDFLNYYNLWLNLDGANSRAFCYRLADEKS